MSQFLQFPQETCFPVLMCACTYTHILTLSCLMRRTWEPLPHSENTCKRCPALPFIFLPSVIFWERICESGGLWKQLQNYPCRRRQQRLPPEGPLWIRHCILTDCHLQQERDQVFLPKSTRRRLVKDIPSHFSKALKLKGISTGYSWK